MNPLGDPPPDQNNAPPIIILSSVLHTVSIPVVAARIWSRARPRYRLWWDDYAILAAAAFDLTNWILILLAIRHGLGRPTFYVSAEDQPLGRMYLYFGQHASGWAIGFAKLSIALMLFRLRQEIILWKTFLTCMMVVSVGIAATTSGFLFAACKPLRAMWDYTTPDPVCVDPNFMSEGIVSTSGLTIATDFVLALLPLTFITRIRRSAREKVLLVAIMGLGLVASAASVCKIVDVTNKKLTGDTLLDGVNVTFWGILEIQLGIIAACVPCLKRPTERILIKLGLMTSRDGPTFYHVERHHTPAADPRSPPAHEAATPYPNTDTEDAGYEMTPHGSARGPKPWDAVMRNDNELEKH
ncbi:hypothetical protein OQA88_10938 [Cercophora sp. LCS_1]